MKSYEDIPEADKKMAEDIRQLESVVDNLECKNEIRAKLYVCLAHDFFIIDMNEEGNNLLLKAEKECPGYFQNIQKSQMQEDSKYDWIVKNFSKYIVNDSF